MEKQSFINEMTSNFNLREPKSKKATNIYFIVCIEGKQFKDCYQALPLITWMNSVSYSQKVNLIQSNG